MVHPLLRDQRAIAGIGRAHANEILLARGFVQGVDRARALEVETLAVAIRADLERALESRERGKGDKDVYLVHNRLDEPCPQWDADRARRLRGAHDLLLASAPDRWAHPR